ncbi:MAG: Hsp70 family protein, partial [Stellaceae bacterium]
AEALIHTTERTLKESGDKVPPGDREAVEQAMAALKGVLGSEDPAQIKAKQDALAQVSMKIGEAIYKAQTGPGPEAGPQPGAQQGGGGQAEGDKVVDADFEEVDDSKKRSSGD